MKNSGLIPNQDLVLNCVKCGNDMVEYEKLDLDMFAAIKGRVNVQVR